MSNFALKFKVVLWKNYILWKRHYLLSIFEILMPLLIFSMLSFVHIVSPEFNKVFINETEHHEKWTPSDNFTCKLYYTPNNSNVTDFIANITGLSDPDGFKTEYDMEIAIQNYISKHKKDSNFDIPVGVVFEEFPKDMLRHVLKYQIRTDSLIQVESLFDYDARPFQPNSKTNYFDKFIPTQLVIEKAFIEQRRNSSELWMNIIHFQEMPYPPHMDRGLLQKYIFLLPLWTILAFIFMFPSLLKRIIEEKSTGIKEFMKMMGLDAWMLWLGWFIQSMVINVIVITIITLILSVNISENTRSMFESIDPSIIWIFLFFYCSASVCFCIFISTLFKKPTLGMCIGILAWVMPYFFFSYLVMRNGPKASYRYFVMIWPNACLIYGFQALSDFELKETGLANSEETQNPSIGVVCLMLIIHCIIFLILTWYIENVFPGEYGIARHWNYPFTTSYWCTKKISASDEHLRRIEGWDWEGIETVSADTPAVIQIRNVSKSFRTKPTVDDLSFDVYENEITVLLGHNGAGKTVTINIITGMISPNSGTVVVNGFNIQSNINKVRESMGFCPQHNLQFSDLTVLEHLMFFAMLKGVSKTAAKLESEQFLARLNMSSKANNMASSLSGGMRRKLSLGMALVGHTRVLILDEPTSGMDPEARRQIWDLLLSMKGERTILITTHYMLEADILGDRIAIMHHGQLMCYGTSLFLKNHYGTGYTLSLLVTNTRNINKTTEVIHNKIASATVKSMSAGFVTFALPTNDTAALSALFSNLEMNKLQLSISSICVSLTTMEEVFLRVMQTDKLLTVVCTCESNSKLNFTPISSNKDLLTGRSLLRHQFLGLLFKRYQYARHRWIMFLLQVLIPLALIAIIMIISDPRPVHRREMVLNPYTRSESFYSFSESILPRLGNIYTKIINSQYGKATMVESSSEDIIKVGVDDLNRYHHTLIASAEFTLIGNAKSWELTAMYGYLALHGPPISLNLLTNTALKVATADASAKITVENNPWPQFKPKAPLKLNTCVITTWIFLFPIAFMILIGFFLHFTHGERRTGFKHLQLMTGVPRVLYWAVIYLFDLIVYVAVGVLVIIIVNIFNFGGPFGNGFSLQALSSLMFLYGFAILPLSYLFIYTATIATSVSFFLAFHFLFGTIATAIVISLEFLGNMYKEIGDGLTYFFYIFPNFAFSNGIYKYITHAEQIYYWENLSPIQKDMYVCPNFTMPCCELNSSECKEFLSYYAGEFSISLNISFLVVHIFLYFVIFFFFESELLRKYYNKLLDSEVGVDSPLDHDVAIEKQRIQNQINGANHLQNDVLQVTNLRKYFLNFYAVRGLNFGVKRNECFGLLGTNGAGKTTAFKMLTGEIFPTTGTANLMGDRLHGKRSNYLKNIGYCPQVDALNLTLTCRETLQLFAYLRGIPSHLIPAHVNTWILNFGIKQYENIRCGKLNRCNKRKLSIAVALIGNPPLVMLDVPTSGADSVARRNLCDILAEVRKSGQSIIVTSHSMADCEALCDRLAIMVDGQIKCIGYIQYLKRKYGQGFTVMMKLKPVAAFNVDVTDSVHEIVSLKRKMEANYCCTLIDEHIGMLLYHVSNRSEKLGEVFLFMERLKSDVEILEDYSICDTSLEEVFLSFAKYKIKDVGECKATANVPAAII